MRFTATRLAAPTLFALLATGTTALAPHAAADQTVTFDVFGPGSVYNITLDPGGSMAPDAPLPWSRTVTVPPGTSMLQIAATGKQDNPGCRITVNGVVLDEEPVGGDAHCVANLDTSSQPQGSTPVPVGQDDGPVPVDDEGGATVTYQVLGSGQTAMIETIPVGGQVFGASAPWQQTFTVPSGEQLYLNVTGENGFKPGCRIIVNGTEQSLHPIGADGHCIGIAP